jgi:Mg-chelatase subunit ChlD
MHEPHLVLQVVPLRSQVLTTHPETVNQVLVALQPSRRQTLGPTQANIMLVLDDSGSMSGPPIEQVLTATRAIIDHLGPWDQLGIVGFADDAEVVHPLAPRLQRESLLRVTDPWVWSHGRRGYGTNMGLGLQRAAEELRRHATPERIQRIIVLTDGFASHPDHALEVARDITRERVSITALGFGGEFDMAFMDRIAAMSGGACEYIDPRALGSAIAHFLDQLSRIQNQLTDNTRITLRFRGDHRIVESWQTHPKVIYQGLARLAPDRTWSHRLADVERKAGLEMLFTIVHPQDEPGRRLVAEVEVRYDLPAAGLFDQVLQDRIVISYGDDPAAFHRIDARVQGRYNDAFVEKQQHRARQLVEAGQHDDAIRSLQTIRKRGNPEVASLAEGTIRKLREQGSVDNESLFRLKMGTQKRQVDPPAADPPAADPPAADPPAADEEGA